MNYEIRITAKAQYDINQTADYIEFSLKNPQAAMTLLDEIDLEISSLSQMPQRYALVSDKLLSAWGIRYVKVKNYLAFYTISDETATVHIVRFLYGKSNWRVLLQNDFVTN